MSRTEEERHCIMISVIIMISEIVMRSEIVMISEIDNQVRPVSDWGERKPPTHQQLEI
ncbi:hypothetical protein CEQ20_07830 [Yersinia pseudotuberculosis]|nr:hypothetical protein BZ19_1017 [Yersinia pseudotuberculosis str. PA3606]AXY33338.1 hypothetical protein CEQ20_07830 [Yersinia pseudotuberculosis]AYX12414.1 hypothetical protein EGX52_17480 [Yersinia pseudotuberculosis]MBO1549147.1 hypothetical protein [Yersinia pseudotuberculosis]MBO1566239.1 hypothetical protein [Yersinia pseudotuberculosis]